MRDLRVCKIFRTFAGEIINYKIMQILKNVFILFLSLGIAVNLWAYDFEVGGLCYNIIPWGGPNAVEITSYTSTPWNGSNYDNLTSIAIPSTVDYDGSNYTVTHIGDYALASCPRLTSVTIPSSVTSIGYGAFYNCSNLASVVIPNSVTSLGNAAFWYCYSLTSMTIPEGIKSIGYATFGSCTSLTSITLPNSITSIGYAAFQSCTALASIDIPNKVTSIAEWAFYNCSELRAVHIGKGVITIGESAFHNCSHLTKIHIPASVASIGTSAFEGCSALDTVLVENGNAIYDSRENCNAIIETATHTLILGCRSTIIPKNIINIGYAAFSGCSSINAITLPTSIRAIGDYAFWQCTALSSLTCQASIVPTTGNSVFYNIPLSKATLYVPETSLEEYKNAEQWQDFGTISPLETAISDVEAPSSVHTQKRITDSQVLIIHNNQVYTITGAVVKID